MKYTTRPYLKYILPIPIFFGIGLIVYFILDFGNKTPTEQNNGLISIFFIVPLLFLPSYLAFKYFKVIEREKGNWTVSYPYLRKKINFNIGNVEIIQIIENISMKNVPKHTQINIRVNGKSSIYINSMETSKFDEILLLIKRDFKGKIHNSDLWKGKL